MRTKQQILGRIDAIIGVEQNKIFTAPSRFMPTNISLIQDKIEGLKALRKVIADSSGRQKDIPSQDWLKKTIKEIVEKHPKLTEGFRSDTKQLLQAIAPGWETFSSPSAASSRSTLYKSSSPEYDYLFKIKLLGDSGVGKSSTLLRFCDNTFTDSFISTIGVDFKIRQLDNIKLQIWDTAGQERFRTITSQYERGMHAAIIIFDTTNQETFANVQKWLAEIRKDELGITQIFMVGNKSDLTDERKVPPVDARDFADQHQLPYIEVSAKDGENVDDLFKYVTECIKGRLEDEYFPTTFEKYLNDRDKGQKPDGGGGCTIS